MTINEKDLIKKLVYRPHIDGLRALAVVLVFIFHLAPDWLPGGYLGVDVFFVISGFVITQSLYKKYLQTGTVQIGQFYLRRFMRLYPALLVMVVLVTVAYIFFGFLWDTNLLLKSSITSILAFSNLYFIKHGENYFDQGSINPLVHTWSLGIEEQFYIVYPFVLLGLFVLYKRHTAKWGSVALTILAILLYLVFLTSSDTLWGNYYWPLARFWELLVGCVLFFITRTPTESKRRDGLACIGLVLILGAVFIQPVTTSVPIESLIAVLGTATMIFAGLHSRSIITDLLSWRPVVFIGLLSYSMYLWHLPIIYFLQLYVSTVPYIVLSSVLTLLFGYLSYRYVEQTLRHSERGKKLIVGSIPYAIVFGVVVMLAVVFTGPRQAITNINLSFNTFGESITAVNLIENRANLGERIEPNYRLAGRNVLATCTEDSMSASSTVYTECLRTDAHDTLVYLTGDSHASHFIPAVDAAVAEYDLYFQGHPRAGLVTKQIVSLADHPAVLNKVTQLSEFSAQYDRIILVTSFFLSPLEQDLPAIEQKLIDYIEAVSPYAEVVFIAPTPVFKAGPASCVANGIHCTISVASDQERRRQTLEMYNVLALNYESVRVYDPYLAICPEEECAIYDVDTDTLRYRDDDHLSAELSRSLAPHFAMWFNQQTWPE